MTRPATDSPTPLLLPDHAARVKQAADRLRGDLDKRCTCGEHKATRLCAHCMGDIPTTRVGSYYCSDACNIADAPVQCARCGTGFRPSSAMGRAICNRCQDVSAAAGRRDDDAAYDFRRWAREERGA